MPTDQPPDHTPAPQPPAPQPGAPDAASEATQTWTPRRGPRFKAAVWLMLAGIGVILLGGLVMGLITLFVGPVQPAG